MLEWFMFCCWYFHETEGHHRPQAHTFEAGGRAIQVLKKHFNAPETPQKSKRLRKSNEGWKRGSDEMNLRTLEEEFFDSYLNASIHYRPFWSGNQKWWNTPTIDHWRMAIDETWMFNLDWIVEEWMSWICTLLRITVMLQSCGQMMKHDLIMIQGFQTTTKFLRGLIRKDLYTSREIGKSRKTLQQVYIVDEMARFLKIFTWAKCHWIGDVSRIDLPRWFLSMVSMLESLFTTSNVFSKTIGGFPSWCSNECVTHWNCISNFSRAQMLSCCPSVDDQGAFLWHTWTVTMRNNVTKSWKIWK